MSQSMNITSQDNPTTSAIVADPGADFESLVLSVLFGGGCNGVADMAAEAVFCAVDSSVAGGSIMTVVVTVEGPYAACLEIMWPKGFVCTGAAAMSVALASTSRANMPFNTFAVMVAATGSPRRLFTPTEAQTPPGHWVLVPSTPRDTQSPASHIAVLPVGSKGGRAGRIVVISSSVVSGSKVVTGATPPSTWLTSDVTGRFTVRGSMVVMGSISCVSDSTSPSEVPLADAVEDDVLAP